MLEDGFSIKDISAWHVIDFGVISNTLLAEKELEIFRNFAFFKNDENKEWGPNLVMLVTEFATYRNEVLEKVEVVARVSNL